MGKAYKAPPPTKKRYRYIANHALERLRERIISLELDHRLDGDLTFWLDSAVEKAIRAGDVKAIIDRREPCKLVNITEQLGAPTFAIIKSNTNKRSPYGEAVVTIMDDVMVAQYQERSAWKPAGQMATALAKLPAGTPVSRTPTPSVETKRPEPVSMLISYVNDDGLTYETVDKGELRKRLLELVTDAGVESETLRAWREVPLNVHVQIDIDL